MREANAQAAGCVLAGGGSRRMGTDKALLELDGKALVSLAVERFAGFPEILVSAADAESYAFTGARIIPDESPGMGPLGGLISVLKAAKSPFVCFRPVDAPLVPAGLHALLSAACAENAQDAAIPVFQNRPEPLLACFAKTSLPAFESLALTGDFKVAHAFPMIGAVYIPLDSPELLSRFGEPSHYIVNANDPDTFSKLR